MNPFAHAQIEPIIDAGRIHARVVEMGRQIADDYPLGDGAPPLRLIGVLKGAIVFLADLARAIERDVSLDFIGVSSYGSATATSGEVRITKDPDEPIEGLDILLVEDIIDTGLTVEKLCAHLRSRGPKSLRVAALLDKPSRRAVAFQADYVGFEIPDQFVVGYGLDFDQRYRNLPGICVLHQGRNE